MIIVEGPDNSGKTTLCNQLAEAFDMKVMHSIQPTSVLAGLHRVDQMIKFQEDYIFDRISLISESVYGPVLRKGSIYGDDAETYFEGFIEIHKPLIIYCDPGINHCVDFGVRAQMDGVIGQAQKLYETYRINMNKLSLVTNLYGFEFESYDWSTDSFQWVLDICKNHKGIE